MAERKEKEFKHEFRDFVKRNKKGFLIVAGTTTSIIIAGLGLSKMVNVEPQKYSGKWFDTVSDEVLNTEREIVRKRFCASGDNFSMAVYFENLLRKFDSVISKRAWAGEAPRGPAYHPEHGTNLYKPD